MNLLWRIYIDKVLKCLIYRYVINGLMNIDLTNRVVSLITRWGCTKGLYQEKIPLTILYLQDYIIMSMDYLILLHGCTQPIWFFIWSKKFIYVFLLFPIGQIDAGVLALLYKSVKIMLNRWYHIIYLYLNMCSTVDRVFL